MNEFIKDVSFYTNNVDVFRIIMFLALFALTILIITVVIRLFYDTKCFVDYIINNVLKDFKSNKNQRSRR